MSIKLGQHAPAIVLPSIQGELFKNTELKGKPYMLDIQAHGFDFIQESYIV